MPLPRLVDGVGWHSCFLFLSTADSAGRGGRSRAGCLGFCAVFTDSRTRSWSSTLSKGRVRGVINEARMSTYRRSLNPVTFSGPALLTRLRSLLDRQSLDAK